MKILNRVETKKIGNGAVQIRNSRCWDGRCEWVVSGNNGHTSYEAFGASKRAALSNFRKGIASLK